MNGTFSLATNAYITSWQINRVAVQGQQGNPGPAGVGVPVPVVNGQWVKGVGGAAVWSPITIPDLPFPRIVAAGTVNGDGSIRSGGGFTAAHLGPGNYRITIPTAVAGMIVACAWPQSTVCGAATESATTFIVYLTTPGAWTDTIFQFVILALA